ncbi:MAG: alpha/beta hydrolase [Pelomonas sp.]|nr:alpha/beta hydrolase [Roseateles sp.]
MALMKFGLALLGAGLIAAALVACSPVTALNALAPTGTHTRTVDVPYASGARRQLDIYTPTQAAPGGGWPVVVFFYGGSWNEGQRRDYAFVGEALASRGILTLVADYRLYPEVRYPDFLRDSAAALAWGLTSAQRLGGNPRRVFVMGHSAGAYNAAMLALDARWLQQNASGRHSPAELAGFIGLAGPYDFLPMTNPDTQPVFFHPNYPPGSQPLSHASAAAPPAFLGAAREDRLVDPQRNTMGLARRLRALHVPVTTQVYDRVSHTTLIGAFGTPLRWLAPVLDDVAAFVERTPPR